MRNISQLVASMMLLATQVSVPHVDQTASAAASANAVGIVEVRLNTNTPAGIEVVGPQKPDYDAQVLAPLHAAEAAAAAQQAAALAAKHVARTVSTRRPVVIASGDVWANLRYCEAGGNYARNSGNGYYGAYQFNIGTWGNYGGYSRPDLAPPAVQDAKARATQAARGWSPWPACARKLGLM